MLPCEIEGMLIHGVRSNGHPKVGVQKSRLKGNCRSEKPISRDVAGSPSDPPTSMGIGDANCKVTAKSNQPIASYTVSQSTMNHIGLSTWDLFRKVLHRTTI